MAHFDARDLNLDLNKKELKSLYKTSPSVHALNLIANWAIIGITIALCIRYFHPLLYVGAITVIGARMHALAILMHDAAHYRFLKNKVWNDRITNIVSMYPLFTSIEKYRPNHLRHHMNLNTEEDPDWFAKLGKKEFVFPKTKREFVFTVLSYFFLIQGLKDAIWFIKRFNPVTKKKSSFWNKYGLNLLFWTLLISILTLMAWWKYYLIFWVVPYFSTFFMFQYVRSVAEHFGELSYEDLLSSTRTTLATPFEKFLFAPHNVGFHLEHHLYPGVPFYNLPKLHRLLMAESDYQGKAHITQGYIRGLLNDLGHHLA